MKKEEIQSLHKSLNILYILTAIYIIVKVVQFIAFSTAHDKTLFAFDVISAILLIITIIDIFIVIANVKGFLENIETNNKVE